MFTRKALTQLEQWHNNPRRKPIILRGARQVGKTTLVSLFAERFAQTISLNLERSEDRELFEKDYDIHELIEALFFLKGKDRQQTDTLIFIDEIQNSPQAVAMLRYFYEDYPELPVIAAGSLLETMLDRHISFPVGRVEYLRMHPLTFEEFLGAIGETQAVEMLNRVPLPEFAHDKLLKLFHRYALIGGMPEIVQVYAETKDISQLGPIYDSLITAYLDDIEKYSPRSQQTPILRHVIQHAFSEAGNRVKLAGFGRSNYGSREIGEALQILEKALLLQRYYPVTDTRLPLQPNLKKAAKLQLLDTGLVNYFAGLQAEIFGSKDLNALYGGRVIEHLVGQEIYASQTSMLFNLNFWVREKKQSNAEVDFVLAHNGKVIPIEVKSGATGRLRSLHQYMDQAEHSVAIRLYAGKLQIEETATLNGKAYTLINLPYYLGSQLTQYLNFTLKPQT
ncbi:MAG: ATP-binding protein [Leucothrix sp.]